MTTPDRIHEPPGKVLIADDNEEARRLLSVRVRREGYEVVFAEDGQKVLDALLREPIDMVLLDVYMPVKDGFEVLAAIKGNPKLATIPVLIISGGGDQEDLVRCIEMGAVDYLSKPFNQALLRARLATCITEKRRRDRDRRSSEQTTADSALRGNLVAVEGPPEAPRRIGRITIKELLGEGFAGKVFLGHHELLDMPVAVKLLHAELQNTPDMHSRILREARLAARLAHRNIVRLHEVGETPFGIYLAYEYVNGGSLEAFLERRPNRQLDVLTALGVIRVLTSALVECNRLGITHRDIKPANILLTQDGRVKLADLGLAKQHGGMVGLDPTGEHVVVGTPAYMAPEQAQASKNIDIRADLYSLGVVLYEMLTGKPPFAGKSSMAVVFAHLVSPVPALRTLRPDLPDWLEGVCMKLLAKECDDRYATPEALLEDLKERVN